MSTDGGTQLFQMYLARSDPTSSVLCQCRPAEPTNYILQRAFDAVSRSWYQSSCSLCEVTKPGSRCLQSLKRTQRAHDG